ncbi:MAG: class I SAM-dependent methyltransferase [Chlamydiales bacterium]|nr:class I SAM-dependent methyltransferase [Chlamydiales bacterium]
MQQSRWIFCLLVLTVTSVCEADFSSHFKKVGEKRPEECAVKNVDLIYLINLDKRPEKLEKSLSQLKPYGITPHRFSAVSGWDLTAEALNELGVSYKPGMLDSAWAAHFPSRASNSPEMDFLRDECFGKTFFSRWMTLGAIGCTLSHLSILQDAYDSGYETIWIMEDDIAIQEDPRKISTLIEQLDRLVGREGWDVLYTDLDTSDAALYTEANDFQSDLKGDLWFFWRPDMDLSDRSVFAKRTILNDDFMRVGSRMRTHSMIIRRSGMKKILEHEKKQHIYIPYDHEIATVPGIQLVSLRRNLVTHVPSPSDTQTNQFDQKSSWEEHKARVLGELSKIPGWYNPKKAEVVMEFVRENAPKLCVEIGAFGGAVTYPIASTLKFLKSGEVYAIDAWDTPAAIEGMENERTILWWKNLNMEEIKKKFLELLSLKQLQQICHPVLGRSRDALKLFQDGSVDLLYLDGNLSKKGSLEDAQLYYSKVKKGGYIWLDNADSENKKQSIAFLMKNCKWIKERSIGINCILFQKTRENLAQNLVHEHGYWIGTDILHEHQFDRPLAAALAEFFKTEQATSVVDFGCGTGEYVDHFLKEKINCEGYDGNPDSAKISNVPVKVVDLSQPFNLGRRFDWVLSIEVGEHLPKQFERTFIENLHQHNAKGVVLSWAVKGQGGFGHFNEQDNSYIKSIMLEQGYENDLEAEGKLRQAAKLPWFKNTLMVFRKKS